MQLLKKWGIRLGIGVLVLILLVAIGLYLSINILVENVVERELTKSTGVETSVGDASVRLFGGSGTLNEIKLANPEPPEFSTEQFLNVHRSNARVRTGSLTESVIELPEVHLDALYINIDRTNDRENYKIVLQRIEERLKQKQKAGQSEWTFMINKLKLTDIRVTFSGYPGMNRTLKLADIHMKNVGSNRNPMTFTRVTALMFRTVIIQLLKNPELLPGAVVAGLSEGLRGLVDLGQISVEFVGDITDGAGNVLKEVGGAAESAVEGVGDAVEGIFGGSDQKGEGSDGGKSDE